MRLKGKFQGWPTKFVIKADDTNDGRSAEVDFEFLIAEGDDTWGDRIQRLAYGNAEQVENEAGTPSYLYLLDSVRPSKRLVWDMHKIKFGRFKAVELQPVLRRVTMPDDGDAKAYMRFNVPVDNAEMMAWFTDSIGKLVTLNFDPAQTEFNFSGANTTVTDTGEETYAA